MSNQEASELHERLTDELITDGLQYTKVKLSRQLKLNELEHKRLRARVALINRLQEKEV